MARSGTSAVTRVVEASANLVGGFGGSESTWTNCLSQIGTVFASFDEDDREARPASESDVIAYIGYLSLNGKMGPVSALEYVTEVSRYH